MGPYDKILDQEAQPSAPAGAQVPMAMLEGLPDPEGPEARASRLTQTLDDEVGARQQRIRGIFEMVSGENPDKAAESARLARSSGLAPDLVARNLDEVRRRERARLLDTTAILQASPVLMRQLSDPDFTRMAHDDVGTLSEIGRWLKGSGYALTAGAAMKTSASLWDWTGAAGDFLAGAAGVLSPGNPVAEGLQRAATGARQTAQDARAVVDGNRPQTRTATEGYVMSGFESAGQNLMMLPLGTLQSGARAVATGMAALVGGGAYTDARVAGLDPARAALYAAPQGMAEYVFEKLPIERLLGDVAARTGFMKLLGRQLAIEVPTEQATTLFQDFNDWVSLHPEKTLRDYLDARPEAAYATLVSTVVATGVQSGALHGVVKLSDRLRGIQQDQEAAQDYGANLTHLMELAHSAKLRDRAPETFRDLAQQMADDGGETQTNVYIDGRTLAQAAETLPPGTLETLLPNASAQLRDAVATNSTVEVPIGEALAALPGTPLESLFVQNAKSSPAALSLVEAGQASTQAEAFIRDEAERVMAEAVNQDQWQAEQQQVHDDVFNQVKALGRWSNKASDAYAQLHAAFFSTLAARLGTTPKALYDRYVLTVRNAEDAPPPLAAVAQTEGNREPGRLSGVQFPGTDQVADTLDGSMRFDQAQRQNAGEGARRNPDENIAPEVGTVNGPESGRVLEQAFRPRHAVEFTRKLDALKAGNLDRNEQIDMGPTPEALRLAGAPNLPLLYKQGEARKTLLEKHAGLVDEETLRRLPDVLSDPILVVKQENGRFGVLIKDGRNQDVLVVVQPGVNVGKRLTNLVVTTHPKSRPDAILNAIEEGRITYRHNEKSRDWLAQAQRQLPGRSSNLDFHGNIATNAQIVKDAPLSQPDGSMAARGTFDPDRLTISLSDTANLSTFLHESGHFFLDVMADLARSPDAPQALKDDMAAVMKWFGVDDVATWSRMSLDEKRPHHERWAESFEQYLLEGKAPANDLRGIFRQFRSWLVSVYRALAAFTAERNPGLSDDVRKVMDRMLASEEQIRASEETAGMLPDFEATSEAIEKLQARSLRDLKWTVAARGRILKRLQSVAASVRRTVAREVRQEIESRNSGYRALRLLRTGKVYAADMNPEQKTAQDAEAKTRVRMNTQAVRDLGYAAEALPRGITSPEGVHPDVVADMLADPMIPDGRTLLHVIGQLEPIEKVVESATERRMLEEHGDLATQKAMEDAANEAIHNDARAHALAAELSAHDEAMNPRRDTGRVDARGSRITVNALVEAANRFGENLAGRTSLKSLKMAIYQHRQAEARAGRAWRDATRSGDTAAAIRAKRDQLLNNRVVKALQDAQNDTEDAFAFFRKAMKGNNEKTVKSGRNPDMVNAIRSVLGLYGFAPRAAKTALDYIHAVEINDPSTFAAVAPSINGALANAKPYGELTIDELRGLHEELQAMWELAKRSRQMEVDGKLLDLEDAAARLMDRMQEIGIPERVPGEGQAITGREELGLKLRFAKALLSRVEQWAERMDGRYGGDFLRLVFQPVKDAADAYRTSRAEYRQSYVELLQAVAPFLPSGQIVAPEIGYIFGTARDSGAAELLHALLHTGNASNLRKLLLGRGWASETEDGGLDTSRWDAFLQRMHDEGVLRKEHYDFAQGVWDLLETMKPAAQEAHRKVFGRYFAEITADTVHTPFGDYRGGYVPAQTDARLVTEAKLRDLAEAENASMAYAFPSTPRGFTKSRVEYNKPLLLDLRALAQHIDKVSLFTAMQPAVNDVRRLLTRKDVGNALDRIDPGAYEGMITPWLNRSARQIVETPVVGDRGISRFAAGMRRRAGMAFMFANISNTVQQITGFSNAAVKVRPSLMMSALARYVANPRETTRTVHAASPFMHDRIANEISAMNGAIEQIILNPSIVQSADRWFGQHAYFLQSAVDNVMSPIIWTAAYNQAIEDKMNERDAVRFADGVIRQTQGSTLPEDISRIETGSPFVRLFTQFIGYFNMMANTNATAFKQAVADTSLVNGAGRALYVALLGLLVPIWVAEAIATAFRGGPGDPDRDGYLDDWLMAVFGFGTVKGLVAMVPGVGQAAQVAWGAFTSTPADNKFSLSPAVSLIESALASPHSVYEAIAAKGSAQKAVRDTASALTMLTGLPIYAVARPAGYVAGMQDRRIVPTGGLDMVRGLLTGNASPESRRVR